MRFLNYIWLEADTMEDIQLIIYIILAVAYFILVQWRKAFKSPGKERPNPNRENRGKKVQQPQRPVTSFEDILRELQPKAEQAKQKGREAMEKAKERLPQPTPVVEAPKYKSLETLPGKAVSLEKSLEAQKAAARAREAQQPGYDVYERKQRKSVSRYARMLQNPASARDAVVLAEIFNRKY